MTSTTTPETIESPDPSVAPLHRPVATRSHRDSVAAFPGALASEWTKLRSLRSNWVILFGAAAIGIVLVWVLAVFVKTDSHTLEAFTVGNSFSFPTWLATVLAVVTGTLMFTSLLLPSAVQLRLRRVTAECFSAHEPSWRLMERLGMRRETHPVSESLHRSGAW